MTHPDLRIQFVKKRSKEISYIKTISCKQTSSSVYYASFQKVDMKSRGASRQLKKATFYQLACLALSISMNAMVLMHV